MAVFNIVKVSELEGGKILTPEFYHPSKILSKQFLENVSTKKIKDYFYSVREIFAPQKENLSQQGIVFDLSDITSYFLYSGRKVTSSEEVGSNKKIFLQNDVLISRLRPYLKEVSFVGINGGLKLASTEFIVLRQKDISYYPETLFAYLISKELQSILAWSITGTEHPRFNEDYFLKLPLPELSEQTHKEIKKIVQSAFKMFLDSLTFYSEAENLLLEELGLKDFKPKFKKTYTAKLSVAFSAHRMDAEHFQPKYEELRSCIRNYPNGYYRITDIAKKSEEIVEPRNYPNKDYHYIELADINQSIGTIESENDIKGKYAPSRARMLLRKGDIIASSVEGSLDKVAMVSEEYNEAIGSTGFFVLRPSLVSSGYLLALVKSTIVQEQLRCESSGTILAAVPAKSLPNIIVPNIPYEKQEEIASLVQQSHTARREAKTLLEKAKRAVEIAIEEGEDKAMEYLNLYI